MSKARRTTGSASRAACRARLVVDSRARSVTGLAGLFGTSLVSLSTCPYGISSTRPTSRKHARAACSVPKGDDLRDAGRCP